MGDLYTIKNICFSLRKQKYTTPRQYEILYKDVWNAISVMNKKHKLCKWVNDDYTYPRIELEGYYWLREVYFAKGKTIMEADIIFFESIIEDYKQVCDENKIAYSIPPFINDDMTIKQIAKLVNRNKVTVEKAFYKLPQSQKGNCYYRNNERYIASVVCDNLCRKHFKKTYLDYLEQLYLMLRKAVKEKGVEVYNV